MSNEGFGHCTAADIRRLDRAWSALKRAEAKVVDERKNVGEVMGDMMAKQSTRKAIAQRCDEIDPQTVTNLVNGRPSRAELRQRAAKNGHGGKTPARASR